MVHINVNSPSYWSIDLDLKLSSVDFFLSQDNWKEHYVLKPCLDYNWKYLVEIVEVLSWSKCPLECLSLRHFSMERLEKLFLWPIIL